MRRALRHMLLGYALLAFAVAACASVAPPALAETVDPPQPPPPAAGDAADSGGDAAGEGAAPPPSPAPEPAPSTPSPTPPPTSGSGGESSGVRPSTDASKVRPRPRGKILICHRTGSSTNPFVLITVDANGLNGHDAHPGDIVPAPASGCPGRDEDCDQHGLPCASIPIVPNRLWGLLAMFGGAAAGAAFMRREKQ